MNAKPPVSHRRPFLRFTLRSLLLLTAVVACWLGVQVNKAHNQRVAVAAIYEMGGAVYYDWQGIPNNGTMGEFLVLDSRDTQRRVPQKVRELVGEEYFQDVVHVGLSNAPVDRHLIRQLSNLPKLRTLYVPAGVDVTLIEAELPSVRLIQPSTATLPD